MANPFAFLCCSGSGKMGDPCINPSDRVDSIRTIRRNLVAKEEILRHRFFHPFFKPMLFFNRPPAISDFPDLIRGFIQRLAETRSGNKKYQKKDKKRHCYILKRITEDCQPFGHAQDKFIFVVSPCKARGSPGLKKDSKPFWA
jgi:hypothetical protein